MCRFLDAGMTNPSTRCGGRRPKSAIGAERKCLADGRNGVFAPQLTWRLLPRSPARLDRAWAKGKVDARCRACEVSFVLWVGAAELGPGRFRRRRRSSPITRRTRHDSRNFHLE